MFGPINPHNEENRAEAIVRSLTDSSQAAEIFAPGKRQTDQNYARFEATEVEAPASRKPTRPVMRVLKTFTLNRPAALDEPIQPAVRSPRQVTTS